MIAELRGTLAFARMTGNADTVSRQEQDKPPGEEDGGMPGATAEVQQEQQRPPVPPRGGGRTATQQRSVQLPVPGTSWVTVQGDFPMTEEAWESMMALLGAMKPGLVAPDDED